MKEKTQALFQADFVKGGGKSSFVRKSGSDEARRVSENVDDQQYRIHVDSLICGEVNA